MNLGKEFVSKKGLVLERNLKKWKFKGKVIVLVCFDIFNFMYYKEISKIYG